MASRGKRRPKGKCGGTRLQTSAGASSRLPVQQPLINFLLRILRGRRTHAKASLGEPTAEHRSVGSAARLDLRPAWVPRRAAQPARTHVWTCEDRALGSCWAPSYNNRLANAGGGPRGGEGGSSGQRLPGGGRSHEPRAPPLAVAPAPTPPKCPSAPAPDAQSAPRDPRRGAASAATAPVWAGRRPDGSAEAAPPRRAEVVWSKLGKQKDSYYLSGAGTGAGSSAVRLPARAEFSAAVKREERARGAA